MPSSRAVSWFSANVLQHPAVKPRLPQGKGGIVPHVGQGSWERHETGRKLSEAQVGTVHCNTAKVISQEHAAGLPETYNE